MTPALLTPALLTPALLTPALLTPALLGEVMTATWPPVRQWRAGPWLIREGAGGGKRVSAASAAGGWTGADLTLARAEMRGLGQSVLFMIGAADAALDRMLTARGFVRRDAVVAYAMALDQPADLSPENLFPENLPPENALDPMAVFAHWPPLAATVALWAAGGIGPARLAVMGRAAGPKTAFLARSQDRPAGAAFVALHGGAAMVHALEVAPPHRRQGSAQNMLRAAGRWARDRGADSLSLLVTEANIPARALYAKLGLQEVGRYHYQEEQTD